ncbi:MAG: hypothetical protein U9Q83_10970 [Bacteroidota bacterium]|nr:hypothetical protein [Bacteroidota bacterium]
MKKIYTLVILSFLSIALLGQEAESFTIIDSVKAHAYKIQKGSEISVKTAAITYVGAINDLTDDNIVVENMSIPWSKVESVKFLDKEQFNKWITIASIALAVNIIFTLAILLTDTSGYGAMVIVLLTLPLLFTTAIFVLIGRFFYKKGRTINYK